jgi:hypothetical protein
MKYWQEYCSTPLIQLGGQHFTKRSILEQQSEHIIIDVIVHYIQKSCLQLLDVQQPLARLKRHVCPQFQVRNQEKNMLFFLEQNRETRILAYIHSGQHVPTYVEGLPLNKR